MAGEKKNASSEELKKAFKKDKEERAALASKSDDTEIKKDNKAPRGKNKYIIINPVLKRSINENSERTAVLCWGEMDPPQDYIKLFQLVNYSANHTDEYPMIFLKNTSEKKYRKIKNLVFGTDIKIIESDHETITQVLSGLDRKYNRIKLIVEPALVNEFERLLSDKNKYQFDSIDVISKLSDNIEMDFHGMIREALEERGELEEKVLSAAQRKKIARNIKKNKHKIKAGRKKAKKKKPTKAVFKKRAKNRAKKIIKDKIAGKGKSYADLPVAAKIAVDKKFEKKKKKVERLAKKILPSLQKEDCNPLFEFNSLVAREKSKHNLCVHMLHDKYGRVRIDRRFRAFKPRNPPGTPVEKSLKRIAEHAIELFGNYQGQLKNEK